MLEKQCEKCGAAFVKVHRGMKKWLATRYCSQACSHAAQRTEKVHPCRICGEPTRYKLSMTTIAGKVHCDNPGCIEASRLLKNARIAERAREMYRLGERQKGNFWAGVKTVSNEEVSLAPWFEALGWEAQVMVRTEVHTNKLPRIARLDFASTSRKLFVEIDGISHRDRKERDERRDGLLSDIGWRGLRVPASLVKNDPDQAKAVIGAWIEGCD